MPVVDLEQENQVRCQGSIWIDDSTSWIILARIFSTFSTGVYIIQFLIRVQSAFRGMQIHFLCHVNFGNFFVYVYCTSEMCTAFEVLEVNISNQYKRWIKIYKKLSVYILQYGTVYNLTYTSNCLQQQHG